MGKWIVHDYRSLRKGAPTKFLAYCKRVVHAMTDNPNLPNSIYPLRQRFFDAVALLEAAYHVALDGGHTAIRDRDKICQELVTILDQLAADLESAFTQNPDALLTTGFTVSQERKKITRGRDPLGVPWNFNVANLNERGKALATATASPGVLVSEIHINQKDPSLEEDWSHKGIFPDSREMEMDNLAAGNTFFRMRHHGKDGPGPWTAVVSITVT